MFMLLPQESCRLCIILRWCRWHSNQSSFANRFDFFLVSEIFGYVTSFKNKIHSNHAKVFFSFFLIKKLA